MNKIKISSKNQKGGITAQNVNMSNGGSQLNVSNLENKKTKNKTKRIILVITGIVAFLAGLVAILEYFNINPFNK